MIRQRTSATLSSEAAAGVSRIGVLLRAFSFVQRTHKRVEVEPVVPVVPEPSTPGGMREFHVTLPDGSLVVVRADLYAD